jgi:hypothetical protein
MSDVTTITYSAGTLPVDVCRQLADHGFRGSPVEVVDRPEILIYRWGSPGWCLGSVIPGGTVCVHDGHLSIINPQ